MTTKTDMPTRLALRYTNNAADTLLQVAGEKGPVGNPPTARLEALTDLLTAAYDLQCAEMYRLHKAGVTFQELGDVLGVSRQAVHAWWTANADGVQQQLPVAKGAGGRTNGGRSPKRPASGGR